jgi:hypothetical protein
MVFQVVNGALLTCAFVVPPGTSSLTVLPVNRASQEPVRGEHLDHKPMVNIMCSACMTPSILQWLPPPRSVGSAHTNAPCRGTPAPWVPGVPNVMLGNMPALDNNCAHVHGRHDHRSFSGQTSELIP